MFHIFKKGFFKKAEQEAAAAQVKIKPGSKNEQRVLRVMEKSGWSKEKAIAEMEDAKARLGISYRDYNRYNFYKIPLKDQEAKYKEVCEKKEKERLQREKAKEKAVKEVMEITGWDREDTEAKIEEARKRTGCAYKEYVTYKFYDLDESVQEQLFLIRDSKKVAKKYDTDKKVYKMLTNKELTNERFSAYLNRPWCVNTKISFKEFQEKFAESGRIIYKPLDGNRGRGVEAYYLTPETMETIFEELAAFPPGVVEEYVVQHGQLSALAPSSVNTLRVVTISSNAEPVTSDGKFMDIAYAALRIGGGSSIVDNFHSGGMVAAVDLSSGELVTDAADMVGNVFVNHPVTGVQIKGFKIPFFEEAVSMVKDAIDETKIDGYLGWDIAISEKGPVLIEINLRPGAVLLTTPYIAEKKGMKHVMEKYL